MGERDTGGAACVYGDNIFPVMDSSGSSRLSRAYLHLANGRVIAFSVVVAGHYALQKSAGIRLEFIDEYLDDLLCMPVVLSLAGAGMALAGFRFRLSAGHIIFTVIYCSLMFEVLLPLVS